MSDVIKIPFFYIFRKLIISENPENTNSEISIKDAVLLDEKNKEKKNW